MDFGKRDAVVWEISLLNTDDIKLNDLCTWTGDVGFLV